MVPAVSANGPCFLPRTDEVPESTSSAPEGLLARIVAIAGLLDKQIAFVTGKGGTGKSTIAYALGLASAARGQRTIVCEMSGQDRGASMFGTPAAGFAESPLAENLWTISIDPDEMVKEYLAIKMPVKAMASVLTAGGLLNYLAAATPGLAEMVSLGKVWELAQDERRAPGAERTYERVIVDAPASGHAVGLLRTPSTFKEIARVGPLAKQAAVIERGLADRSRTGVAVVSTPEESAVTEASELIEKISAEIAVDLIVCNGTLEERFSRMELQRIERAAQQGSAGDADGDAVTLALGAALAEGRLVHRQQGELERLRALEAGASVVEVPDTIAGNEGAIGTTLPAIARALDGVL